MLTWLNSWAWLVGEKSHANRVGTASVTRHAFPDRAQKRRGHLCPPSPELRKSPFWPVSSGLRLPEILSVQLRRGSTQDQGQHPKLDASGSCRERTRDKTKQH